MWAGTAARDPNDENIPSRDWGGGAFECFREADGKLLWGHRSPRLSGKDVGWTEDCPRSVLGSAPLVEGGRLWYASDRTEVVCFDIAPLRMGTGEPTGAWKLDLRQESEVFPHLPLVRLGSAAAVGGYKDELYVVTHNGVGENRTGVPAPDAPCLRCNSPDGFGTTKARRASAAPPDGYPKPAPNRAVSPRHLVLAELISARRPDRFLR